MNARFRPAALAAAFLLLGTAAGAQAPAPAKPKGEAAARGLDLALKPWTGDFDAMLERRIIRVLVPYSRTLFFNDRGRERGITADNVRDFERHVNRKYAKQLGKRPVTVYLIPTTRDKLLPGVASGHGDIAAANLTVTEDRLKVVDFASPANQPAVKEVLVTGPKSPPIATAEALAGKTVHVRRASSYHESLQALNARLQRDGRAPVRLVIVPDALEDEDMMEMLNAGILQAMVVDDWKARMWAQILPRLRVNEGVALREGGKIGWAIRKNSEKLKAEALDFYRDYLKKQGVSAYRLKQYMARVKQIKDPTASRERQRLEQTIDLFEKYGAQYGFDPVMLAAQGYQESQLDQNARSRVGAIGIMQIMPATGKELKVGDIRVTEPNVHAGAKYLDWLMSRHFPDAKFSEGDRPLFAFASYNAGPGNITKMRKEAARRGLDPDRWFNHVELVVAERIGAETTTYVRNIYKYYVSYKLLMDAQETAKRARDQVAPGGKGQ